jgi:hypothetical protein
VVVTDDNLSIVSATTRFSRVFCTFGLSLESAY